MRTGTGQPAAPRMSSRTAQSGAHVITPANRPAQPFVPVTRAPPATPGHIRRMMNPRMTTRNTAPGGQQPNAPAPPAAPPQPQPNTQVQVPAPPILHVLTQGQALDPKRYPGPHEVNRTPAYKYSAFTTTPTTIRERTNSVNFKFPFPTNNGTQNLHLNRNNTENGMILFNPISLQIAATKSFRIVADPNVQQQQNVVTPKVDALLMQSFIDPSETGSNTQKEVKDTNEKIFKGIAIKKGRVQPGQVGTSTIQKISNVNTQDITHLSMEEDREYYILPHQVGAAPQANPIFNFVQSTNTDENMMDNICRIIKQLKVSKAYQEECLILPCLLNRFGFSGECVGDRFVMSCLQKDVDLDETTPMYETVCADLILTQWFKKSLELNTAGNDWRYTRFVVPVWFPVKGVWNPAKGKASHENHVGFLLLQRETELQNNVAREVARLYYFEPLKPHSAKKGMGLPAAVLYITQVLGQDSIRRIFGGQMITQGNCTAMVAASLAKMVLEDAYPDGNHDFQSVPWTKESKLIDLQHQPNGANLNVSCAEWILSKPL